MKLVTPIYGQDYKPGTHMFMREPGNWISDGVCWFGSFEEACAFSSSHVIMVVDEKTGLECSEYGVQYFPLSKYFDGKHEIVCREPLGMDELSVKQALDYGAILQSGAKGYAGYDGLALFLGYPIAVLSEQLRFFPWLRKIPVPFHLPNGRVCSVFMADMMKHTDRYKDAEIFYQWNMTRITPVILYNEFPYKPFRYEAH